MKFAMLLIFACAAVAFGQSSKQIKKEQLQRPCEVKIAGTPDDIKPLIIASLAPHKWGIAAPEVVKTYASQADLVLSRPNSGKIGKEGLRVMILASNDGSWPSQVHTTANVYFTLVPGDGATIVTCQFDITYQDKFVPLAHAKGMEPDDKITMLEVLDGLKH
jgi:hypothetical protein